MPQEQLTADVPPVAAEAAAQAAAAPSPPPMDLNSPLAPLPILQCAISPDEVVKRLDFAARRGRMAGFQREAPPALFSVEAFAAPFEHKLIAAASGQPTRLAFTVKPLSKMIWIYAVTIVLCIWPGTWLTHSMIVSWFPSWYPAAEWVTWAWYLPLLVVPLLWMLPRQWKKCRVEAHADALVQIEKLAQELDATRG